MASVLDQLKYQYKNGGMFMKIIFINLAVFLFSKPLQLSLFLQKEILIQYYISTTFLLLIQIQYYLSQDHGESLPTCFYILISFISSATC